MEVDVPLQQQLEQVWLKQRVYSRPSLMPEASWRRGFESLWRLGECGICGEGKWTYRTNRTYGTYLSEVLKALRRRANYSQ